jgi:hypothetical protein
MSVCNLLFVNQADPGEEHAWMSWYLLVAKVCIPAEQHFT